ncbi:hypothetical protein [Oceanobacillus sp. FSL W7-1293]|uniref:hypothetical protein n=1 Tax=Oceanobacillus sp. FSL W7-1293 TaxID=2921699 RepID=UPI0030CA74F1
MLKNHYLEKDLSLVETELGKLLVAFEKSKTMVENAQFEDNQEIISEITGALANLHMLNRRKIDADVTADAMECIRRAYG